MGQAFLDKFRRGDVVLGVGNMYPASGIVEGMCAGWDFVWVDGQHGEMSYDSCLHALQAANAMGIGSMLRVPGHEPGFLAPFADLAPDAIMVPMVNTVEEAKRAVAALSFPPRGTRSYGGRRVIDLYGREFYKNNPPLIITQVETIESVENAEAIARVDGVDGLFFGPDDMRAQMGIPINTAVLDNPRLTEALEKTAAGVKRAGKKFGTVAPAGPMFKRCIELGMTLIVGGADVVYLRTGAAKSLTDMREMLGATQSAAPSKDQPTATTRGGVY